MSTVDLETGSNQNLVKKESWITVLTLAYQSLGVVYGDLSTSPLYVYKSTFAEDIEHSQTNEEIYGVLSFVFWTLTLVPLLKYVFIVLRADDSGEGGTFALYSLLCRHARVSSLPNCQLADEELSSYKKEITGPDGIYDLFHFGHARSLEQAKKSKPATMRLPTNSRARLS